MRPLGWFCSRLLKSFSYRAQLVQQVLDFLDEIKENLVGDYDPSESERRRTRRALQARPPRYVGMIEPQSPRRPAPLTRNPSRSWASNPSVAVRDTMAQRSQR